MAMDRVVTAEDAAAAGAKPQAAAPLDQEMQTLDGKITAEGAMEALKSAPRGYPKDHPRIQFLRMKEIVAGASLLPGDALHDRRVFDFAMSTWKTAQPLNIWLDANVGPTGSGAPGKFGR